MAGAEREATAAAEEHEAQEAVTALQMELVKTQDLSAGLEKALSEAQEANALSAKQGRQVWVGGGSPFLARF